MSVSNESFHNIGGISFHHLGLLTDNASAATKVLTGFGYVVSEPVRDPIQCVELRMARGWGGVADIEIITPFPQNGPLSSLLRRRNDYVYHSCFSVENLDFVLAQLLKLGVRVTTISPSKPAVLFGQASVSFHSIEGMGLVEFVHYDK